jgi:hypothetical protein
MNGHLDCLRYAHENGAIWTCPPRMSNQNTLIYCIQNKLKITCSFKISNTIMRYLNQDPIFKLDNNNMEIQRRCQEVILKRHVFELSQILKNNLIPDLSLIVQRYIY